MMDLGIQDKNRQAKEVFDMGDYAEAVKLYDTNLLLDPGNEEAFIYRGIALAYESTMENFMIDEALEACANGFYTYGLKRNREELYHLVYHASKELIHMTVGLLDRVLSFYENTVGENVTYDRCIGHLEEIKMVQEFVANLISEDMINKDLPFREVKLLALQALMDTNLQICRKKMTGVSFGM
mgnify:CR=1 FL=1